MSDKGLPHLPLGMLPRGLTKAQAAAYCGCETLAAFDEWVRKEIVPKAMLGTNRWDRKAIDRALDRRSGLIADAGANESYDEWLARQD
ncbi:UNVERIFIED_CONTAM: hypothetical protein Q9R58_25440 [Methylobacteriaceae bacterium AG10]|nr:hypothetical protein [Methylobacteriaceae bacterium AG10]